MLKKPSPALSFENGLHSSGGEVFHFSFFLRPWGDRWSDAPEGQKPFYFDDWYLPLLKEDAPMPESIPWEKLELAREGR